MINVIFRWFLLLCLIVLSGCASVNNKYLDACKEGELSQIMNLSSEFEINYQNNDGINGLMLAAYYGNSDVLIYLISNGIDLELVDKNGNTALVYAVKGEDPEITLLLTEKYLENDGDEYVKELVLFLAENGCADLIDKILNQGVPSNYYGRKGWTPLMHAVWGGHVETCRLLIKRGAKINVKSKNDLETWPLKIAAVTGNSEVLQLLLENGADFYQKNSNNETLLMTALWDNNIPLLNSLIELGYDVDEYYEGIPLLFIAGSLGYKEFGNILIKNGVEQEIDLNDTTITFDYFINNMDLSEFREEWER